MERWQARIDKRSTTAPLEECPIGEHSFELPREPDIGDKVKEVSSMQEGLVTLM